MLERMWRNGNPLALLVVMQTGAAAVENSTQVSQRVKNRGAWLAQLEEHTSELQSLSVSQK